MRQFLCFGLIGLLNTGLHLAVLMALVELGGFPPAPANVAAFLCANVFSYLLNSSLTFRQRSTLRGYAGFLVCSAVGAALAWLLVRGAELAQWHYLVGFALTVVLLPPVNFLMVRRFAFRAGEPAA
ncbi:GtrA family protein [Paracidovorax citrulli]